MKKLTALWLSLLLAFGTLTGCAGQIGIIGGADGPTAIITSDSASAVSVTEDGQYDSKDEVSAYLTEYGHLPSNYITKKQAQALGWQGGSLEPYAPGCSIGGDRFGNYEGTLPVLSGVLRLQYLLYFFCSNHPVHPSYKSEYHERSVLLKMVLHQTTQ